MVLGESSMLLRNAGRGAYSGVGNTTYAGKSLSFHTVAAPGLQRRARKIWLASVSHVCYSLS